VTSLGVVLPAVLALLSVATPPRAGGTMIENEIETAATARGEMVADSDGKRSAASKVTTGNGMSGDLREVTAEESLLHGATRRLAPWRTNSEYPTSLAHQTRTPRIHGKTTTNQRQYQRRQRLVSL
jgi:hypothetical protein